MDASLNMTKTSFKKECDINEIMRRFQTKGVIDHYAARAPEFIDVPALDYQDGLNIVAAAQENFAGLPSSIRAKFQNDPANYLAYVEDPKNLEEMRTLGLANPLPPVNPEPKAATTTPAPASPKPKTTEEPKA